MEEKTTLSTTYVVNNTNRFVTLSLLMGGPDQTASSLITLNGEQFDPKDGDVFDMQIGRNADLDAKELIIVTTISDTSPDHNHTELILRLKGGSIFREFTLSQEVQEGQSVSYVCRITFFNLS